MKTLAQTLTAIASREYQVEEKPQDKQQPSYLQPLTQESSEKALVVYSEEDKKQMITCLGACMAVQRTYGKQAQELPEVVKVFTQALSHYSASDVTGAIKEWLLISPEFPTPADIEAILNPPFKPDYAVYSRLLARSKTEHLDDQEWKYIEKYESNAMRGL